MRDRLLWIGVFVYSAVLFALGALRYAVHRNFVDFGIFAQTAASAFGCFCNPIEGSHWAFHFSPILYVVAVFLKIAHSPLTLIALQSIACALAAPPIYAIVRARTDVSTARMAALVVWLYPPLLGLAFGDFHENGFAPAAVAWTAYAFDAGLLGWAALCAVLAIAVKEDQAIFMGIAGLGTAFAYRGDRRKMLFGIGVAALGALVALLFFFVIQPHANALPSWQPARFYAWSSGDWAQFVRSGFLQRLGFLLLILAPLAFLPVRTRAFWLAAAPLLEVLASRMSTTFTMGTHYAGAWTGYLLIAFAAGVAVLAARARRALWWAIALCAVELLVANPLHLGLNLRLVQPRDRALDAAQVLFLGDADVATQEEAYAHLALGDANARLLPESPAAPLDACFVLIDRDFPDSPRLQEYGKRFDELVAEGTYVLMDRNAGVQVYRRKDCR